MTVAIRAIYEYGKLRPLDPLELEENAVVRISLEAADTDVERTEWLAQSQRSLMAVWDHDIIDYTIPPRFRRRCPKESGPRSAARVITNWPYNWRCLPQSQGIVGKNHLPEELPNT